jgi:methionyl-tRNA synthetase
VDFVLTVEELRRVCNGILCRKAGNLLRRLAVPLSQARGPRRIDGNDPVVSRFRDVTLPALRAQLLRLRVRGAVNEVTAWVHHVNAVLEERRLFAASPESDGLRAFLLAATLTLLEPVVPGLVRDYPAFAGWTPGAPIEAALECPVPQPGTLWREI